ncbi:MAG: hypothetical protein L6V80_07225 [Bacteroidales bacterium]|nr:MAG: hypothetical protein L6V80_07225 [Bacteroidales bacterium]
MPIGSPKKSTAQGVVAGDLVDAVWYCYKCREDAQRKEYDAAAFAVERLLRKKP